MTAGANFPTGCAISQGGRFFNIAAKYVMNQEHKHPGDVGELKYYDYRTLEYNSDWKENKRYFEMTRGMDKSFGYNQFSQSKDYITTARLWVIPAGY